MTQDHKLTVRFKRLKELLFFSESCQCPGARGTGGTSKDVGGADVRSLRGTYSLSAARSYTMRSYTMLVQNELRNVPRIYTCVRLREAARVS
jgi:hypothetical protein